MPQLDPSSFPTQLIWLAISFVILFLLMSRVALPRIARVLEERQNRIDGNLDKAQALKVEAEAARESYEKALEAARTEGLDRLTGTADSLAREAAERHRALKESLARQVREAEQRIVEAREKAIKNVRVIAAEIAGEATAKLIGAQVDEKSVETALDAASGRED